MRTYISFGLFVNISQKLIVYELKKYHWNSYEMNKWIMLCGAAAQTTHLNDSILICGFAFVSYVSCAVTALYCNSCCCMHIKWNRFYELVDRFSGLIGIKDGPHSGRRLSHCFHLNIDVCYTVLFRLVICFFDSDFMHLLRTNKRYVITANSLYAANYKLANTNRFSILNACAFATTATPATMSVQIFCGHKCAFCLAKERFLCNLNTAIFHPKTYAYRCVAIWRNVCTEMRYLQRCRGETHREREKQIESKSKWDD